MTTLLSRISLRYQILSVGLLGAVGIAALACVYMVGSSQVREQRAAADVATQLEHHVNKADLRLLEARHIENGFFLRSDGADIVRHANVIMAAKDELTKAEYQISSAIQLSELLADVTKINEGLAKYVQQFNSAVDLQRRLGSGLVN